MFRVAVRTIAWSLLVTSITMRSALAVGVRTPSIVDLETEEILATGDDVPGFGTIGESGFQLLGMDDGGRILIRGQVSDGRHGFYWVDAGQITPIWVADESSIDLRHAWGALTPASVSRNGNIVTLANEAGGGLAVYAIDAAGVRRVAGQDDVVDASGNRLCALLDSEEQYAQLAINDAGTVAFVAWIGRDCEAFRYEDYCNNDHEECLPSAVFVAAGNTLRQIDPGSGPFVLRGVARDGTVVIDARTSEWQTLRVSPSGARQVIDPAAFGLEREWPSPADHRVAMSDSGEVAFVAMQAGQRALYRTDGARIVEVVRETELPSSDLTSTIIDEVALNDAGAVLVRSFSYSPAGDETRRLLFYDANGDLKRSEPAPAVILAQALTNSGLVAYASSDAIFRAGNAVIETVLTAGAAAPGGGEFAVGGLTDVACLGGGGIVGSGAVSVNGQRGLVCADADGAHTIARSADDAPEGGFFGAVQGCTIAGSDVVFSCGARSRHRIRTRGR